MSPNLYKVIHLAGVIFLFMALGAVVLRSMLGDNEVGKKIAGITHGVALLVILFSGFAILGTAGYPLGAWVWIKVVIWLALGGITVLMRKMAGKAAMWWWVAGLLGAAAAYLGVMKPM